MVFYESVLSYPHNLRDMMIAKQRGRKMRYNINAVPDRYKALATLFNFFGYISPKYSRRAKTNARYLYIGPMIFAILIAEQGNSRSVRVADYLDLMYVGIKYILADIRLNRFPHLEKSAVAEPYRSHMLIGLARYR